MTSIRWTGRSAGDALLRSLKSKNFSPLPTGGESQGEGKPAVSVIRGPMPAKPISPWIWLTPRAVTLAAIGSAVERGAIDVISEEDPHWEDRLLARLEETLVELPKLTPPEGFVAQSASSLALLRQLQQAAYTSMPVLLTGETGSGKELAARLIHRWSSRAKATFVPINCAAIPNEMMEGELFGSAKGAFSGSVRDYPGLLTAAEGGTVFLDEIDDTPFSLQVKLLRVLEDRVISRLGENQWREVNFRTIAASNRDLRALIAQGTFGPDLYERLSTLEIRVPPLRERTEDLPALVQQLVERFYREDKAPARRSRVRELTPEALAMLSAYAWPGNVRELRNVIYGALVVKRAGAQLLVSDLPQRLWAAPKTEVLEPLVASKMINGTFNLKAELEALERAALKEALRQSNGNAAEAARLLGEVGRGTAKDPGGTVRTMIRRLAL